MDLRTPSTFRIFMTIYMFLLYLGLPFMNQSFMYTLAFFILWGLYVKCDKRNIVVPAVLFLGYMIPFVVGSYLGGTYPLSMVYARAGASFFSLLMGYSSVRDNNKTPATIINRTIFNLSLAGSIYVFFSTINTIIIRGITIKGQQRYFVTMWSEQEIQATTGIAEFAILGVCLFGCLAGGVYKQLTKIQKFAVIFGIISAVLFSFYGGSRTTIVIIVLVFSISLLSSKSKLTSKISGLLILALVIAGVMILYHYNIFDLKDIFDESNLLARTEAGFFDGSDFTSGRMHRYRLQLEHFFTHPFGGRPFYDYIHNFWLDAHSAGGILSFVFSVAYTVLYLRDIYVFTTQYDIDDTTRVLIISFTIAVMAYISVEPVIDGAIRFVMIWMILHGMVRAKMADMPRMSKLKTKKAQRFRFSL